MITLALYFSGLFVIFTPLPLAYYYLQGERRWTGLLKMVLAILFVLFLLYTLALPSLYTFYTASPEWAWILPLPGMNFLDHFSGQAVTLFGLTYFALLAGIATLLGLCFQSPQKKFRLVGQGIIVSFIFVSLVVIAFALVREVHMTLSLQAYLKIFFQDLVLFQKKQGLDMRQLAFMQDNLDELVQSVLSILPALTFCAILLITIFNLVVAKRLFGGLVTKTDPMNLNQWSLSFNAVWLFIGCIALVLLNMYFFQETLVQFFCTNILIVLLFLYLLQGLGIVSCFFVKKNVPPLMRYLFYGLMILLLKRIGVLLIGLGFFDAWFDFRKLHSEPKK